MRVDECYQLGYIVKTHGLKGEVIILLDVDNPLEYMEMESVFLLQNKDLIPFFIARFSLQGNKAIAKFEDIDTLDSAKKLMGCKLYLPLEDLPDLPRGGYYYHDLIGFDVLEKGEKLGSIKSIYQPSSQYLAALEVKGKEVLIPIDDNIIRKVNKDQKEIEVDLPEGLLDIYLEDS